MIYDTAQSWRDAPEKRVALFGMSGLGKTHVSTLLRDQGGWFHYSVDYRIGTHYMGEHIEDAFKAEAMGVPYLADLLRSDSIKIRSNIRFDNLAPLSTFLGKPGNPDKGGLPFAEYLRRQNLHREAEANALIDTGHFIDRAKRIYGYGNFICDTSGSICEVVDPKDPTDPVLSELSSKVLLVWIRGSDAHTDELARRFEKAPKPMYYNPRFLMAAWEDFRGSKEDAEVDPDAFVRWAYRRALDHRQPVYADMAENWGVSVDAEDVAGIRSTADFEALIASALETRG
jgi:hypothetical protein